MSLRTLFLLPLLFAFQANADEYRCGFEVGTSLADAELSNLAVINLDRSIRGVLNSGKATSEVYSALGCIDALQSQGALVDVPNYDSSLEILKAGAKSSKKFQDMLMSFTYHSILTRMTEGRDYQKLYANLKGSILESAAYGVISVSRSDWKKAKPALMKALSNPSKNEVARAQSPALRLDLARTLYALGEDAAAVAEYEKLYRIGLPMQDALIESAWAHLRTKNYAKAIGLSYELTTGKLAQFFAPEAQSIRAIGFVENCRYSESKKTIDAMIAAYTPVQAWLKTANSRQLYETSIARSEGAVGDEAVPAKVWSVWSSSDLFVSLQKGIHQSFTESKMAPEWIGDNAEGAKSQLLSDLKTLGELRAKAAIRIEEHLKSLNNSMSERITAETSRLALVRVDANQGAGRDIVYRNANPGVGEIEKKVVKADRKAKSYQGKLAWGNVKADDPAAEMWIDEIGSFEAKALDLCKVKEAYKNSKVKK